ncbi:MAG: hypothetical protein GC161_17765 [Planctomycetaceae bacterium]|nr:hypothetical protein [Planctomycetaceae bacterium]
MKPILATSLALLAAAIQPAEAQNRILLLPGQSLPGAGMVTEVGDFAINSEGSWVAFARTDQAPFSSGVLVRDGQPLVVPDGLGPAPQFSAASIYLDLDDAGNIGYLAVDPATGDWLLMRNQTVVLQRGELLDIDGDGITEPVTSFRSAHLAQDGSGAVYAVLNSGVDVSLVRLLRNAQGVLESQVVVAAGQTLPTGQAALSHALVSLRYRSQLDSNSNGELVFALTFQGVFVYSPQTRSLKAVVQANGDGPLLGTYWSVEVSQAVALADDGAAYFPQPDWITRNQQIAVWPSMGLEFPEGVQVTSITTDGAVRIAPDGQVLWTGRFQIPGSGPRRGIARNTTVVVLDGETRVEGLTIANTAVGQHSHDFTGDGERILFRARTSDDRTGLFEVDLAGSVETLAGCVPKLAELQEFGTAGLGLTRLGTATPVLGQPQDPEALALLLISPQGADGCGVVLPGVGEVLVSLQPELLFVLGPAAKGCCSAIFQIEPPPSVLDYLGFAVYAQGLWYDPLHPTEPVRMSNALRYTVGL